MSSAEAGGDVEVAETWQRRLHHYLDCFFQKDPSAGVDFHSLQVRIGYGWEMSRAFSWKT